MPVHVGELGCYERTPDDATHAWFVDLFDVDRRLLDLMQSTRVPG